MGPLCSSSCQQMVLTATVCFMVVLTTCSTKECRLQMAEKLKDKNAFLTKADIKLIQLACMDDSCHQSDGESKKIDKTHGSSVHQEDHPKVQTELCGSVICNQTSKCVQKGHGKICVEASTTPGQSKTAPPASLTTQDSDVHVSVSTSDASEDLTPSKTVPPAPVTTQESDPHANPSQARNGDLSDACEDGDLERVKRILAAGHVDINAREGWWGRTPVMLAVLWEQSDVVEFLVGKGADVSLVDMDGANVLHYACQLGLLEIVKLILSLNMLDINTRNNKGMTAADTAKHWGNQRVLDLLVSRGAH